MGRRVRDIRLIIIIKGGDALATLESVAGVGRNGGTGERGIKIKQRDLEYTGGLGEQGSCLKTCHIRTGATEMIP